MKCVNCFEQAEWLDKYCQECWENHCSITFWDQISKGNEKMNKNELVSAVASEASVPQKISNAVICPTMEVIMETVSKGEKVTLLGFGSFESL
jgi:N-acetylmuramoyl-L-alanine amidase CwlA